MEPNTKPERKYYRCAPKIRCVQCGVEIYEGRLEIHNNSVAHKLCEKIYNRVVNEVTPRTRVEV